MHFNNVQVFVMLNFILARKSRFGIEMDIRFTKDIEENNNVRMSTPNFDAILHGKV